MCTSSRDPSRTKEVSPSWHTEPWQIREERELTAEPGAEMASKASSRESMSLTG